MPEHSFILTYTNTLHMKICKQMRPLSYDIKALNGRKNANIRQLRVSFLRIVTSWQRIVIS